MRFTGVCCGAQGNADLSAKTLQTWSQYVTSLSFLLYPPQQCLLVLNWVTLPCFLKAQIDLGGGKIYIYIYLRVGFWKEQDK